MRPETCANKFLLRKDFHYKKICCFTNAIIFTNTILKTQASEPKNFNE